MIGALLRSRPCRAFHGDPRDMCSQVAAEHTGHDNADAAISEDVLLCSAAVSLSNCRPAATSRRLRAAPCNRAAGWSGRRHRGPTRCCSSHWRGHTQVGNRATDQGLGPPASSRQAGRSHARRRAAAPSLESPSQRAAPPADHRRRRAHSNAAVHHAPLGSRRETARQSSPRR